MSTFPGFVVSSGPIIGSGYRSYVTTSLWSSQFVRLLADRSIKGPDLRFLPSKRSKYSGFPPKRVGWIYCYCINRVICDMPDGLLSDEPTFEAPLDGVIVIYSLVCPPS